MSASIHDLDDPFLRPGAGVDTDGRVVLFARDEAGPMFVLSFAGPDHAATVLRQWLELVESVRPPVPADPTDAF